MRAAPMGWCHMSSTALLALASALARASAGRCSPPSSPPARPRRATDLNGVAWPDLCIEGELPREEHFFVIGDWGGVFHSPAAPVLTANQAHRRGRPFVAGVDDFAQHRVAAQMRKRASVTRPRYVINVGDNFYWGGIDTHCGQPDHLIRTGQWQYVFEDIYTGSDLAGKPWMGVLGNHDYGGWMYTAGWDQQIMYTWGPSKRWLTPALYWSRKVVYPDFTVDMFFVDSNVNDAHHPMDFPNSNMCSMAHNIGNTSCGTTGPSSIWECKDWFHRLWAEQLPWLEAGLDSSGAEWQVVVTHFPPDYKIDYWAWLSEKYGVDLIIGGHRHQEEVHYEDGFAGGVLGSTAWIVAGGGGGITSEGTPRLDGQDDMYGFMDVAISKEEVRIDAISHGGVLRSSTKVWPRRSIAERSRTTTTATPTRLRTTTLSSTQSTTASTTQTTTSASADFNSTSAEDSISATTAGPTALDNTTTTTTASTGDESTSADSSDATVTSPAAPSATATTAAAPLV